MKKTDPQKAIRKIAEERVVLSIKAVKIRDPFTLVLTLSNGQVVTRSLEAFVQKAPGILARLRKPSFFAKARVSHGAVTWPGQIDLCPLEMIYGRNWIRSRSVPEHLEV